MDIFGKNIILAFSAFASAFIITTVTLHLVIRISHHLELFDSPNERKVHTGKISRLGGVGIFIGFLISVSLSPLIIGFWMRTPFSVYGKILPKILFIVPTLIVFLVGLMDDFREMKAYLKLALQIFAALIVMAAGARIQVLSLPFTWTTVNLGIWSWPITFIWIIGIVNAINLVDGMDGLAAIISTISFMVYALVFMLNNNFILAIISVVMVGTLLGYLMFNFPPARVFMGDSGSMVLGFLLAVLPLVAKSESGSFMYIPVTLMLIPIGDVLSAVLRRTRRGISFSVPDKEHFHHKLLAIGLKERFILMLVSCILLAASIPLVLMTIIPIQDIGIFVIITWAVIAAGFIVLHYLFRQHRKINGENKISKT